MSTLENRQFVYQNNNSNQSNTVIQLAKELSASTIKHITDAGPKSWIISGTDRRTDGRTDGPTDGRTDGPTDGRTDVPWLQQYLLDFWIKTRRRSEQVCGRSH